MSTEGWIEEADLEVFLFAVVHGRIGGADEVVLSAAVFGEEGDADGGVDGDDAEVDFDGVAEAFAESVGEFESGDGGDWSGQSYNEFIATQAGNGITLTYASCQSFCHLFEQHISNVMA